MLATTGMSWDIELDLPALNDKKMLITGTARGIGLEMALQATLAGADVVGIGLSEGGTLEASNREVNKLREFLGKAPLQWFACDVTDEEDVVFAFIGAQNELDYQIDFLVLNAGIAAPFSVIDDDIDAFRKMIEVNIVGVRNVVHAAGSLVVESKGTFVYMCSMAAKMPLPLMGIYAATKAFIEAMAKAQRMEIAHTGAKVLVVFLNPINTGMTDHGLKAKAAQGIKKLVRPVPLPKTVTTILWAMALDYREVYVPKLMRAVPFIEQSAQRFVAIAITATGKAEQALKDHLDDPNRNEVSTEQEKKIKA